MVPADGGPCPSLPRSAFGLTGMPDWGWVAPDRLHTTWLPTFERQASQCEAARGGGGVRSRVRERERETVSVRVRTTLAWMIRAHPVSLLNCELGANLDEWPAPGYDDVWRRARAKTGRRAARRRPHAPWPQWRGVLRRLVSGLTGRRTCLPAPKSWSQAPGGIGSTHDEIRRLWHSFDTLAALFFLLLLISDRLEGYGCFAN